MDMDDERPALIGIEEEFAQLDAELKRIAAMPAETPEQRNALLLALQGFRAEWNDKVRAGDDAPAWRRSIDGAIARGFDGLIAALGRTGDGAGGISQQMLQEHLKPVFDELGVGLRQNLVEKFGKRPPPGTPPPQVNAADVAGMLFTLFGPPKQK
jgi:hypothetical protein